MKTAQRMVEIAKLDILKAIDGRTRPFVIAIAKGYPVNQVNGFMTEMKRDGLIEYDGFIPFKTEKGCQYSKLPVTPYATDEDIQQYESRHEPILLDKEDEIYR